MEKTLEDLKLEADSLRVTYSANIGAAKLQGKIDAYYDNESKSADITTAKVEDEKDEVATAKTSKMTARQKALAEIKKLEIENAKTDIVKVTMVDKRESSTATDAYFSNGNYAMKIPLDVWVEMPKILIDRAENEKCMSHRETDSGAVAVYTKKYVVEYKRR